VTDRLAISDEFARLTWSSAMTEAGIEKLKALKGVKVEMQDE
jgi:hypothetical protein